MIEHPAIKELTTATTCIRLAISQVRHAKARGNLSNGAIELIENVQARLELAATVLDAIADCAGRREEGEPL